MLIKEFNINEVVCGGMRGHGKSAGNAGLSVRLSVRLPACLPSFLAYTKLANFVPRLVRSLICQNVSKWRMSMPEHHPGSYIYDIISNFYFILIFFV